MTFIIHSRLFTSGTKTSLNLWPALAPVRIRRDPGIGSNPATGAYIVESGIQIENEIYIVPGMRHSPASRPRYAGPIVARV